MYEYWVYGLVRMFCIMLCFFLIFCFKQKTAYEMRIIHWSSDVCSSDLGENAASRYDSVLFAGQGAQLVVIVVIVLVHLAFPLGDCRLDLDQLRGFFLGRIALASGFQMAAHPVGIRPVELPFCIAPAIFARRLGDGVEPILHKVHDKARIIAIATFSEKIGGEGAA